MEKEIKKPVKILFVCLGNICRSPAAEGVFKHMLRQRGITGRFEVDSAGTYGGEMKDILESVTVLTPKGEQKKLYKEELQLGYRTSVVKEKGYIILKVHCSLSRNLQQRNIM